MKAVLTTCVVLFFIVTSHAQESTERHSMFGKIELAQNEPNPVRCNEVTAINYRALDAQDVAILLFDADGKRIHTYEDLHPGEGQIKIRKPLSPGKYFYALVVNGRLVSKKQMDVVD